MMLRRFFFVLVFLVACGSGPTPDPPPPCDQLCLDGIGVAALRTTLKQIFNATLQGNPVGPQDAMYTCPLGGSAHVAGTATSNAIQGATMVDLTYELNACVLLNQDTDPKQVYNVTSTGTIHQVGTFAVQPTATTSVGLESDSVTITGTVYDPPDPYEVQGCRLQAVQDGNSLAGLVCERSFTSDL